MPEMPARITATLQEYAAMPARLTSQKQTMSNSV